MPSETVDRSCRVTFRTATGGKVWDATAGRPVELVLFAKTETEARDIAAAELAKNPELGSAYVRVETSVLITR